MRLCILENGNIGINNTNPTSMLYVSGDIYATGNITAYSDQRAKNVISGLSNTLDIIQNINGYKYKFKDEYLSISPSNVQIGFLAQEVQKYIPEIVSYDDTNDRYGINYIGMIPVLLESIKEMRQHITSLQDEVNILKAQLSTQPAR